MHVAKILLFISFVYWIREKYKKYLTHDLGKVQMCPTPQKKKSQTLRQERN